MFNIQSTKRCHLFEEIASHVWAHIIHNHNAGIEVSEIGITNDIASIIRNHYTRIPNFRVWSNPGHKESVNGSDIDIFVESSVGSFVWYAFQAKVLKLNGKYSDISGTRGGEYQWDKLNRLSIKAGCRSRYLFYNGVSGFNSSTMDQCKRQFLEPQFGCSIVDVPTVMSIAQNRNPSFNDFHPSAAQPWRVIVCCFQKKKGNTFYSIEQVKNSVKYYEGEPTQIMFQSEDNISTVQNEFGPNAINEFSMDVERIPFLRMVVRSTAGLSRYR